MKKISLFLLMTLFATLSFSADSITRKLVLLEQFEKEIMPIQQIFHLELLLKIKV